VTQVATHHGVQEFHVERVGHSAPVLVRRAYVVCTFHATFLTPSEDIRPYGTVLYSFLCVLILPCLFDHAWRNASSSAPVKMVTNVPPPKTPDEPEERKPMGTLDKIACVCCFPMVIAGAAFSVVVRVARVVAKYFYSWWNPFLRNLLVALLNTKKEVMEISPLGSGVHWKISKTRSDDGGAVLHLTSTVDSRGDGWGYPRELNLPDSLGCGDEFEVALGPFESFCLFRRNSKPPPPPPRRTSDAVPPGDDSRV
jgi:hypothetical protein